MSESPAKRPRPTAPRCRIGASMLACDLSELGAEAQKVLDAGADYLHLDVMDGHFVPNLSWGMPVIKSLRAKTAGYLDVHLMVSDAGQWIAPMKDAGAQTFTFHLEAVPGGGADPKEVHALIDQVRAQGMAVGIAIKPKTPAAALQPYLPHIDMALVMTVEPGFGGQAFMEEMMPKVAQIRRWAPSLDVQVDGGLSPKTVAAAAAAGANVIVAGSSVFKGVPADAIRAMRAAVEAAPPLPPEAPADPPPAAAPASAAKPQLSAADQLKRDAGYRAIDAHVRSGMAVGLGTGSTAYFAVERLGQKLASGELVDIIAVPTSIRTREQAESLGIPLTTLDEQARLDVAIDGADAVDRELELIKGGGGAMHREKMVALRAAKFVTIVDDTKLCEELGPSFPLPVEISQFCAKATIREIEALPALVGCEPRLRLGSAANNKVDGEEPAVTDNGNYVVDLFFKAPIGSPTEAAAQLKTVVGVVDHGFFCGMAAEAIVAGKSGVYVLHPASRS